MGRVLINGESVEFEGEAPQTCAQACELIEGFLSGQGLMVESVSVDGSEVSIEAARNVGAFEEVSFVSLSPEQQLLGMCKGWEVDCLALVKEMDGLSTKVLKCEWNDSQVAVVELLEKLRPLLEGFGVLLDYGKSSSASWERSVSSGFEGGVASINSAVDAVESRDCVVLSDCLAFSMSAGWAGLALCLAEEVIPVIEESLLS